MRVIIESPFAGGWKNVVYGRQCVLDSLGRGESPYASHLLYAQRGMLDDKDAEQRRRGIAAADGWLEVADYVAVYCDLGITEGMLVGVIKAARMGKPVRMRWIQNEYREVSLDESNQNPRTGPVEDGLHVRGRETMDLQRLGLLRNS